MGESESDYDDGDPYSCIARGADLELYEARVRARLFKEQVAECFYSGDTELELLLEQNRQAVIDSLNAILEEEPWKHPRRHEWATLKLRDLSRSHRPQLSQVWEAKDTDDEPIETKPRGLGAWMRRLLGR
jgi:hypothetical protein